MKAFMHVVYRIVFVAIVGLSFTCRAGSTRVKPPEATYNEDVAEGGGETMDIFEPGMRNLFDTGRIVIDAVLAGEL